MKIITIMNENINELEIYRKIKELIVIKKMECQ